MFHLAKQEALKSVVSMLRKSDKCLTTNVSVRVIGSCAEGVTNHFVGKFELRQTEDRPASYFRIGIRGEGNQPLDALFAEGDKCDRTGQPYAVLDDVAQVHKPLDNIRVGQSCKTQRRLGDECGLLCFQRCGQLSCGNRAQGCFARIHVSENKSSKLANVAV